MNVDQQLYLIAHAPQTIPNWFRPEIPKAPLILANPEDVFGEIRKYWSDEHEEWTDEGKVSEDRRKAAHEYMAKFRASQQAYDDWYHDSKVQLHVQWPIFWANEVLKKVYPKDVWTQM